MCRLFYLNSKEKINAGKFLEKFALISRNSKEYQGHGWGMAYWVDGERKIYKNIKPIWEDDLTKFGYTNRIIAHARSAFRDEGIVVENNMPFYDDKYVFIFNGELRGVRIKEDGRIGAEKIFNYIKRFDRGSIKDALLKGASIISKKSAYVRAMNIIIADNYSAYVYSKFNEDPDYFTMHKKIDNNIILVSSDPFPNESNWQKIENESITEFRCF
ncbi:class II glutamine amidotransferase [Melioribacter sp. OK-6-Me]|uniref:class II glutamine amidotransferase n=1 Tax=unclassified Melioribacter TaxID=2627329 RepID=UPI003ED957FB